ncbi:MAG: ATP-binding protein, partial [Deltaproteobacteria bacterium]|nr:ATP-binding protein [Deltaproteobacteria bacterium]
SRSGNVIAADIGTNAEVVLKSHQGLIACSSPAGPALEGGQIRDGMRAALGAIDRVTAERDIVIHTIGDAPALGICGSGLIDAVAVLLDLGIIDKTGRLHVEPKAVLPEAIAARLRNGEDNAPEFVLAWAANSGNHLDIVLSQSDIRQLQLAKAAIMSGVRALLQQVDLEIGDIDSFLLAGGFGNYINVRNARRIGLIPDLAG